MTIDILLQPISSLIPLKTHTLQALQRLKINLVRDLLLHKPNYYTQRIMYPDLSKLKHGDVIITEVTIQDISMPKSRGRPIKIYASNDTGGITMIFFNKIPPHIYSGLRIGATKIIQGKVEWNDFYYQIAHPEFIWDKGRASNIEPIYPLTYGINNKQIQDYVAKALTAVKGRAKGEVCKVVESLEYIHAPKDLQLVDHHIKMLARYELLANQLALSKIRKHNSIYRGRAFTVADSLQSNVLQKLGFKLSDAQRGAITEIGMHQSSETRMNHMLQGDVGSGKTLVALMSILNVVSKGVQAALMAPTELLASQHFAFFTKALEGTGINVGLLTGKTKGKERKLILDSLRKGEILILIGTHALFQEKVEFHDLGYIVIDEQHKFGVMQRIELLNKAKHPDLLIMTATPIPRSLTMTLFGDMSVSQMLSKPTNRPEIATILKSSKKLPEVIDALHRKLSLHEKIYWVCPLIENDQDTTDKSEFSIQDVTSRFDVLNQYFPGKVGLLHGKMSAEDKESTMQQFKFGSIDILVTTTVIEVGIDVPNATLMVIENAERFGLAQLHQLRGRVGRSDLPSHCILLYEYLAGMVKQRLEVMRSSTDGFYIAEQDLVLRGGGEILGTKQSGEVEFYFADLARDMAMLVECKKASENKDAMGKYQELIYLFYGEYDKVLCG